MSQQNDDFIPTYADGQPYKPARGRKAPRKRIEDVTDSLKVVIDRVAMHPTGPCSANVVLTVIANGVEVIFDGVVVKEARPGWITVDVPPLETWSEAITLLSPAQRERLESPEFYLRLQAYLSSRLLEQKKRAGESTGRRAEAR